ncbi:MAG: 50S ribosomal protein L21 [Myxococcota bacterium]
MYAVIQTGGKQYRVAEGDLFFVEKLPGEKDQEIVFDQVLMLGGEQPQIGAPLLPQARVVCEVVEQFRGKKILVYKFKRRKKYRRRQGHRQSYTRLRVKQITA